MWGPLVLLETVGGEKSALLVGLPVPGSDTGDYTARNLTGAINAMIEQAGLRTGLKPADGLPRNPPRRIPGRTLRASSTVVHQGRLTAVVRTQITGKNRRRVLEVMSTHCAKA